MQKLTRYDYWLRVRISVAVGVLLFTAGCAGVQSAEPSVAQLEDGSVATIEMPLLSGWYGGSLVFYLTTDVSQSAMAQKAHANYAPRMRHALHLPVPGEPSAVDRVYKFSNFAQGSVFPSAPLLSGGTGANSGASSDYTPFWVVYMVTWLPGSKPHVLRSEQEVTDAEDKKLVSIAETDVVVNCPILFSKQSGVPEGLKVRIPNP